MSDAEARKTALDPTRSFLVQAPAGSGKTELLIRRYLNLLARVQQPEQIVAITFTRKAAAEMRQRILAALSDAAERTAEQCLGHPTLELARAALGRNAALEWHLREQPERLRIDTLDALNAYLAQRLPLLSGGVAQAGIAENPAHHYETAADRAVTAMLGRDENDPNLRTLAVEYGGDLGSLTALLAKLLPRRDQWLRHLVQTDSAGLRAVLEQGLGRLIDETLKDAECLLGAEAIGIVEALLDGGREQQDPPQDGTAVDSMLFGRETTAHDLGWWRRCAGLWITQVGEWRRQPPPKVKIDARHPERREAWRELLRQLRQRPSANAMLRRIQGLPERHYGTRQMRILAALRAVLIRVAAELQIVFAEQHSVDFVELALRAQQALGDSDQPSELLLALDRRIEHILVDEFQDTSHQQLRLLELLTSGWQRGDGRTVFLVGDPMQSIYRFRDADVSLFLSVGQRGLGAVTTDNLRLTQNFRSAGALVDWINEAFALALPGDDNLETGFARFVASEVASLQSREGAVRVHAMRSDEPADETDRVATIVAEEMLRAPHQSLAILVQSRAHLAGLGAALEARGIQAHAIETETIETRQSGQDLMALTRALVHLADRAAWLGVLRAPWCGLTWRDLEALCAGAGERSVWELIQEPSRLDRLTTDGKRRIEATRETLTDAFARRAYSPFAGWVRETWEALGGPSCVPQEEAALADRYFATLSQLAIGQDLEDPGKLAGSLSGLAAQGTVPEEAGVEIMTMHRAKGLEFDTVVLFGLGREPSTEAQRALYWAERVARDGQRDLLLAPLCSRRVTSGSGGLTAYLKWIERERERAERARLLYVAMTRAREHLHLVGRLGVDASTPPSRSLLAPIWRHIEADFRLLPRRRAMPDQAARRLGLSAPLRRRMTLATPVWQPLRHIPRERPPFEWAGHTAAAIGTLVHRELQRLASRGLPESGACDVGARVARYRGELGLRGVAPTEIDAAAERVVQALQGALEDPRGRWLLDRHDEARSELPLTVRTALGLRSVVLDRTFVAEGVRWIVDFKTSSHEGGALDEFLAAEVERYRGQLERYAVAMHEFDSRPIRLGLYFPLLPAFCGWRSGAVAKDFQIG